MIKYYVLPYCVTLMIKLDVYEFSRHCYCVNIIIRSVRHTDGARQGFICRFFLVEQTINKNVVAIADQTRSRANGSFKRFKRDLNGRCLFLQRTRERQRGRVCRMPVSCARACIHSDRGYLYGQIVTRSDVGDVYGVDECARNFRGKKKSASTRIVLFLSTHTCIKR